MPAETAIILLNMGGPLRLRDVKPFLLRLFQDRDIIPLGPERLQSLVAHLIVRMRLKEVKDRYAQIGGGSPILKESAAQAAALRSALRAVGRQELVKLVFRYASPRAAGELCALRYQGIRRLLPVSLYPHDCRATTGSSLRELEREAKAMGMGMGMGMEILPGVLNYATDPGYLDALEEGIRHELSKAPGATLLFSAHGLPRKQIEAGDPYEGEIHATMEALKSRLGAIPGGYVLGYQSRVGLLPWLGPSLESVLIGLSGRDVIVVPISFVSEHIETLYELDIHYRRMALGKGIRSYLRVPTPGLHPAFIQCLAQRVISCLSLS